MAMVCPQCHSAYEQRLQCPHCEIRLDFLERRSPGGRGHAPRPWQVTIWGRILIGLILAQGIFHGLRHLSVAWLLAVESGDQNELWGTVPGLLLLLSLQIVSLFFGALLAGAGQQQGALYGGVLGIWNGVLLVLVQPVQNEIMHAFAVYGLPLLHGALGALAGWVGSRVWKPITPVAVPGASRIVLKAVTRQRKKWFAGPIVFTRVIMGTSLAVAGGLWASVLLNLVINTSEHNLTTRSARQAEVVIWEITALAILTGAALAGALTRNGMKQGLVVGLGTSIVLLGIRLAAPVTPSFFLLATTMFLPPIVGILGGGFGSQLFPPLTALRHKSFDAS
jgi:hypothetical protein